VHRFDVVADHFQVIVADEGWDEDLGELWTPTAADQMLAQGDRIISIGTLRCVTLPVEIQIVPERPEVPLADVDHLVEGSLSIQSGTLLVETCEGSIECAPRIAVPAGTYQVLYAARGIRTIKDEYGAADDVYRVYLWPGPRLDTRVLKHWRRDV
jgi:hypothetical protein